MGDSGRMGVMAENFETILYVVDGSVATITMNRPDMANAQDSTLIDEIDAALDLADADDAVRVVILAGAGKHFSSGHDLKALVSDDGSDPWVTMRETPEGKFQHEKTMYFDRCLRIHDFRKPTIAAQEAWRLGLVNRVVPRAELEERTRELADRVALVPPVTAQTVKEPSTR